MFFLFADAAVVFEMGRSIKVVSIIFNPFPSFLCTYKYADPYILYADYIVIEEYVCH